jgi:hypothetical protein
VCGARDIFQRECRERKAVTVTVSTSEPLLGSDRGGTIVVYTLEPCAPCEIVKDALKLLEGHARKLSWNIEIVPTMLGDKKGLGAAFLAGVKRFPTVRLIRHRRVLKSFVSVMEGWTAQDVASFLRSAIEAETETIELGCNEVPVSR